MTRARLLTGGEHVITLIAATMQRQRSVFHGLSSPDRDGRRAAIHLVRSALDAAQELAAEAGRTIIRAVLVQSAPRIGLRAIDAHAEALEQSLLEITQWNWGDTRLVLEHCDSFSGAHVNKGFVPLDVELEVLSALPPGSTQVGMGINWGRSVLDTGSPEGALAQLRMARDAGLLRFVALSGVSSRSTALGSAWSDTHLPIATGGVLKSRLSGNLFQPEVAREFIEQASDYVDAVILKVASVPPSDGLETIRDSLRALRIPSAPH